MYIFLWILLILIIIIALALGFFYYQGVNYVVPKVDSTVKSSEVPDSTSVKSEDSSKTISELIPKNSENKLDSTVQLSTSINV